MILRVFPQVRFPPFQLIWSKMTLVELASIYSVDFFPLDTLYTFMAFGLIYAM
ncbi:hypothetical protein Hanom_Chr06g00566351 [Helianthus anomalus]